MQKLICFTKMLLQYNNYLLHLAFWFDYYVLYYFYIFFYIRIASGELFLHADVFVVAVGGGMRAAYYDGVCMRAKIGWRQTLEHALTPPVSVNWRWNPGW